MKIILDGKECEMSFGSFFKGYVLSWLLLSAILLIAALFLSFTFS